MADTPKQKKASPPSQAFFFAGASHGDEWGFCLFAKIDTRCVRADKSNSEDGQKLVHFCPTVYILYALFQKYREKKDFFVYHFFCICFNSFSFFFKQFLLFFLDMHVDSSPKLLDLKELDRCSGPQIEVIIVTWKEYA